MLVNTITLTLPNPVPSYWDENKETSPLSVLVNSNITFKSEKITVTFNGQKASVQATYVFKNNGSTRASAGIRLPFSSIPANIELSIGETAADYSWEYNTSLGEISEQKYHSITFSVDIVANEEKEVQVMYERDYLIYSYDERLFTHEFSYLVGTIRSWNRSLDSAKFEFVIPSSLCGLGIEINGGEYDGNTSFSQSLNHITTTLALTDWMPEHDLLTIKFQGEKIDLLTIIIENRIPLLLFPFSLFIVCSYFFIKVFKRVHVGEQPPVIEKR
jgi:hypothetical protein